MWLHDVFRAYFDTADLTALTDAQREAGIDALLADFERAEQETHKLFLWTLLSAVGGAPCPAATHLDERSRRIAYHLMQRMPADSAECRPQRNACVHPPSPCCRPA